MDCGFLEFQRQNECNMKKLNNTYYILRHGEALSNIKHMNSSWPEMFRNHLTPKGVNQVKESVQKLINKKVNVDFIFYSDLLRTTQTAEIASKMLKVKPRIEKRLREIDFGTANGKPIEELLYMSFAKKRINHTFKRGETYYHVLRRVLSFLKEIDSRYKGKTILLISHQATLWILENRVEGYSLKEGIKRVPKEKRIGKGELRLLVPGKSTNK